MDPSRLREASFASDRLEMLQRLEDLEKEEHRQSFLAENLHHHPDDDTDDEWSFSRLYGGVEYVQIHVRMGIWLAALLVGYLFQRVTCQFGVPGDCVRAITYLEFYSDMTSLFFYGLALGWFIGITESYRFLWIFSWQNWYLGVIFLGFLPFYSIISDIPGVNFQIVDGNAPEETYLSIVIVAICFCLMGLCIIWHIKRAWSSQDIAAFLVYVVPRTTLLVWFGTSAIVLHMQGTHIHVHHLFIGWAFALWSNTNTKLSGISLVIGASLFIQGLASYSMAPIFLGNGCFETGSSMSTSCSFKAAEPFTLRICPSTGISPEHHCTMTTSSSSSSSS